MEFLFDVRRFDKFIFLDEFHEVFTLIVFWSPETPQERNQKYAPDGAVVGLFTNWKSEISKNGRPLVALLSRLSWITFTQQRTTKYSESKTKSRSSAKVSRMEERFWTSMTSHQLWAFPAKSLRKYRWSYSNLIRIMETMSRATQHLLLKHSLQQLWTWTASKLFVNLSWRSRSREREIRQDSAIGSKI